MHVGASRRSATAAVTTFRGELLANDARSLGVLALQTTSSERSAFPVPWCFRSGPRRIAVEVSSSHPEKRHIQRYLERAAGTDRDPLIGVASQRIRYGARMQNVSLYQLCRGVGLSQWLVWFVQRSSLLTRLLAS
ncbi:hypothetical protein F1559_003567 [Cyanidiococcus yangmingshanensis]|uniref:Uncharacterized protein n=1 Tax=Cyanidiococcus yangmingshanensis TaxID=2690220 RepID=A0A7J7IHC9_9RHOD|nr:hypothetical protein F1559_003567 [Cyanidiococcus yangmingshanensis]